MHRPFSGSTLARFGLGSSTFGGVVMGLAIAVIPRVDGSITMLGFIGIVAASAFLYTIASLGRLGVIKSMVLYPAVMVPLLITLRLHGVVLCDDALGFAMLLVIFLGMTGSYYLGWIHSQPDA